MRTTDTLIIGGGQAGLALSHELTVAGRDHVVVERGRLAQRWAVERPPTLRLLTPSWLTRLPGWPYRGPDPEGFMTSRELARHLARWATAFGAPLEEQTTVESVAGNGAGDGFTVRTDQGSWRATDVVLATGHAQEPMVPGIAAGLAPTVHQVVPSAYRGPASLPDGGVLVVGASATGLQVAEELAATGRRVVLAVGEHSRLPRRYRGLDILWWLDRMGAFAVDVDDVGDIDRIRRQPSWQLVGRPEGGDLDLVTARAAGVELVGRLTGADGTTVRFAPDLPTTTARADCRLERLLARIDAHAAEAGLAAEVDPPERPPPVAPGPGPDHLDLAAAGISTVVWATGYRQSWPWLHVPVLDRRGEVRQHRGVTPCPGLYTVGLRAQTRAHAPFVDAAGHDAREVAARITGSSLAVATTATGPVR